MPSERPRKVQGFNDLEDQVEDGGSDIDHDAEDDPREDSDDASGPAESSRAASNKRKRDPEASSDRKGKSKSKRKAPTPGIVYISRLPPGMTPQKVRHLMARWGEVGKVYAQRRDAPAGYDPKSATARKQRQKHRQADFTEAWVEFLDKAMAKTVAQMLNAQVIGGKKGDRWRDDIWTMRYLSGFKWEMLGEQVAYEKQAHQARLRNEITRSKAEQGEYLRNVELARVLAKRKQRKIDAGGADDKVEDPASKSSQGDGADERRKGYRQRPGVDRAAEAKGAGMESVLDSIF